MIGVNLLTTFATLALNGKADLRNTILALNNRRSADYFVLKIVKAILKPRVMITYTRIIVSRSAESIKFRTITLGYYFSAAIHKVTNSTCVKVNIDVITLTFNVHFVLSFCHVDGLLSSHLLHGGSLDISTLHTELLLHLHIPLLGPRHIFTLHKLYLYKVFASWVKLVVVIIQHILLALTRTKNILGTHQRLILFNTNAIFVKWPYYLIALEWFKVVFVEYFNAALLQINCFDAYILIYLLYFKVLCLGWEVGTHHTIHTEHTIVRFVVRTKVATITPVFLSCFRINTFHSLVNPVPNGTTHKEVGAFNGIPIVNQVAHSITHRVCVLWNVVRVLHVVVTLNSTLHPSYRWILIWTEVDNIVVALILHGAALVVLLDGCIAILKVFARTSFVAKTPYYNWWMVNGRMYHLHVTSNVSIAELRYVRKAFLAIIVLMTLKVGFIFQIDTILVAQVVPIRRIRIVWIAYMVNVAALHEEYFLLHLLAADIVTRLWIVFVTIYAFKLDGLTI